MGYFNEFPHTRNYDGDLGYLIKIYKKLVAEYASIEDQYEALTKIYEMIQNDIKNITIEQLQQWLEDGTLADIINGVADLSEVKNISFINAYLDWGEYHV